MAGFGGYNEKKKKKQKQGSGSASQSTFSSKPVFVMPKVIEKDRKEK